MYVQVFYCTYSKHRQPQIYGRIFSLIFEQDEVQSFDVVTTSAKTTLTHYTE